MASNNTTVHSKMGIVDATGRVSQFCPRIAGTDVFVSGNDYGSGNSIQEMNDNLGKIAFDNTFEGIDDNATSGASKTYSSKKINTIKTESINKHDDITDAYNNGYDALKNKIKSLNVDFPDSDERDPNVMANKIDDVYNKGYNSAYDDEESRFNSTTATPSDVLEGKTFSSGASGINVSGTMPKIGYNSRGYINLKVGSGDTYKNKIYVESSGRTIVPCEIMNKIISTDVTYNTPGDTRTDFTFSGSYTGSSISIIKIVTYGVSGIYYDCPANSIVANNSSFGFHISSINVTISDDGHTIYVNGTGYTSNKTKIDLSVFQSRIDIAVLCEFS